ncbi:hypothetical protein ACSBR1_017798 [Camellia fascicularis]
MQVGSRFTRWYGATTVREWYLELPGGVQQIIDEAGFGLFSTGLSHLFACRTVLGVLVERWLDLLIRSTSTYLLRIRLCPVYLVRRLLQRERAYDDRGDGVARGFLMFLFGMTLFVDRSNTVGLYLLSALVDLSHLYILDMLSALHFLHTAYCTHSLISVLHLYFLHTLWVYTYFPVLASELEVKTPPEVPYSRRYDGRCQPRARETLPYLRHYFDIVRPAEVILKLTVFLHFQLYFTLHIYWQLMHLLSADYMAALGGDARVCPIPFCWSLGRLPILDLN